MQINNRKRKSRKLRQKQKLSKKGSQTGIDFCCEDELDPIDLIRMRIIQQTIFDYAQAWKHLSTISEYPEDPRIWSFKQIKYASRHLIRDLKMIHDVRIFLLDSKWFYELYADMDGAAINTAMIRHFRNKYGNLPDSDRVHVIVAFIEEVGTV